LDTGTHLVMGLGIAGLAYIDPVVASNPTVAAAVLIGAIIGQQAPDFDTVLRLKGNSTYIKHHRGISHSIPAVMIWTLLITGALGLFINNLPLLHVGLWVFAAVAIHIFSDMFNTYGTQSLRPFTKKWVAWDIIPIFDPVIFIAHIIAIVLWMLNVFAPSVIFPFLYGFLVIYYIARTCLHAYWLRRMPALDKLHAANDIYKVIPSFMPSKWTVVKQSGDRFTYGELRSGWLHWVDSVRSESHPAVEASKNHPTIEAFLSFTPFMCAETKRHEWGYEVHWIDIRCRQRKNYPFVAVLLMDLSFHPIEAHIGWMNESRIEKRLGLSAMQP
jgi:inner membrane protein